ncbi:MAG: deoxyribodipyrimidine photo-lyase [Verrucomicrobiae bacterium]|nr:deoxyribodipyrimidine photo-lyase [Verrucomicrobiae bacterium]
MTRSDVTVIHWFRRDLRITDNTALFHACARELPVIPVYFLSTWANEHHWTGPKRQKFLCESLESLSGNLKSIDGRLIIRRGDAVEGLRKLAKDAGAIAIHFNLDPDPYGKETEARLRRMCAELGIECHGHADATLHTPSEVLTQSGDPYRVYTPYSRNWLGLGKSAPLGKVKDLRTPDGLKSEELPTLSHWGWDDPDADILEPGERAARKRLKTAVSGRIGAYKDLRDNPAVDGTSRLSQDLRFGLVSIRTIYAEAMKHHGQADADGRKGVDTFIKELAWREFYFAILHHYPDVLEHEFNPDWRGLPWDEPGETFDAWKSGRTGFPIVDAGMRQLLATGYMHNRLRMITAMFLTKDLHIDWKLGESFFMQHLVDGEIASNNGGWQWSAGTGADAAPYFRIQNPWMQSARHDPEGEYIRRWVPELKDVPSKQLHHPPEDGKPIAKNYPLPCVDHHAERDRTLEIFKKHKERKQNG